MPPLDQASTNGLVVENVSGQLWKILLVGGGESEVLRIERALASLNVPRAGVECASSQTAGDRLAENPYDIVFVNLDALAEDGMITLRALRAQTPATPLLAIARDADEAAAIEALRAGAQDFLTSTEIDGQGFVRAMRHAIERSRYQTQLEDLDGEEARDREIMKIGTLGPPPLTVSQRSLGSYPLCEREPGEFDALVRDYGQLLDRALLGRSPKEQEQGANALNLMADRLGTLSAGPRDAIDLHRAAMKERLESKWPGKSKAYVEEGRLLLLQLMGYLASFYRNMSWGQALNLRRGARPSPLLPDHTRERGKRKR